MAVEAVLVGEVRRSLEPSPLLLEAPDHGGELEQRELVRDTPAKLQKPTTSATNPRCCT